MPNAHDSNVENQLSAALAAIDPRKSLIALVIEFSQAGMSDEDIIDLLLTRHSRAQDNEDQWQQEALLGDVLDMMQGFFIPNPQNPELMQFVEHFRTKKMET